jgi:hypothetical protein
MLKLGASLEEKILDVSTQYIALSLKMDEQAIASAKEIVATYIGVYNLQVLVYKALWEGYAADATVLKARVDANDSLVRMYESQIRGELAKAEVTGQADRLMIDPFHEATVARDDPGAVIDQRIAESGVQMSLCDCHANSHGQSLAQRPGGTFDPRQLEILWVPGAGAMELAKALDVVDRRRVVTRQIEQSVDQHRPVAGREHKAIPVVPVRCLRIELQIFCKQCRRDVRHAHRHARVPRVRGLDGVHRKGADRVGHLLRRCGHAVSLLRVARSHATDRPFVAVACGRQLGGERAAACYTVGACYSVAKL